jgi:hypothetical protein
LFTLSASFAKGPCCIPDLAAELIRTGVDIFVVEGAADAGRVQQVTRTIPIVTLRAGDVVKAASPPAWQDPAAT